MGRMDRGLKCPINHGKVIGNIMGGDTRKTYGTIRVPQLAVFTSAQKDHSQVADEHS